jgi:CheY-like chemotaxis protein
MSILVVEDDYALQKIIARALASCGHQVLGAGTGVEALGQLKGKAPDLVVLDLHLPEMDGWEFLRRFRGKRECAHVPVVVMSAEHRIPRNRHDFQAKPFDLDAFLDVVQQLRAGTNDARARDLLAVAKTSGVATDSGAGAN